MGDEGEPFYTVRLKLEQLSRLFRISRNRLTERVNSIGAQAGDDVTEVVLPEPKAPGRPKLVVELRGESLSIQEIADRYGIGYFRVYRAYTGGRLEALIKKIESKKASLDLP
jgi:hypothetical protein